MIILEPITINEDTNKNYKAAAILLSKTITHCRICSAEGEWSGTGNQIECKMWNCQPPPALANGTINYTSTSLNSSALYTCDAGYEFSPTSTFRSVSGDTPRTLVAVCNDERLWLTESNDVLDEDFFCHQINCPEPPVIHNTLLVDVVTGFHVVNATVRYECLAGFEHLGSRPELTCTDTGTWSLPFFECLRIDCGPPQPIRHGNFTTDDVTGVGAVAEYACDTDHYLATYERTRTCGPNGLWTSEYIECLPYGQEHCGDPPWIGNASVQVNSAQILQVALYTCAEGYEHAWANSYECSDLFRSWFGPEVHCQPVNCSDPPYVEYSNVSYQKTIFGSQAVYFCHADRLAPNGNTKPCTSEGSWTAEPVVECLLPETITCGSPPHIPHSSRTYTSTVNGSVALYACDYGFTGKQFEASCGADGRWELRDPHDCSPVDCGAVPIIENSVTTRVSDTTYGHVAVYECLQDFTHTGPSLKTCEANQRWSSYIVECAPENSISCGDPPKRDHANVTFESRAAGAIARYSCIAGYKGNDTGSVCQTDGQWSESDILCEPVYCDAPMARAHSIVQPNDQHIRYGQSVIHFCFQGYVPSTNSPLVSTCLEDGSWSQVDGFCDTPIIDMGVECAGDPPVIPNGRVSSQTGTHVGATMQYSCDAAHFPVLPPEVFSITCLPGGKWSSKPLTCVASQCLTDAKPNVANSVFRGLRDLSPPSSTVEAIFECDEGYTTDGLPQTSINYQVIIYCDMLTGWLSGSLDIQGCLPVDCGTIQATGDLETVR